MRGKATGSSCVKLNSQDHPRVCGEKPERKAPRRPRLGSPPRMRGKETDSRRQCCSAGITPAYAGKRTLFCLAGRRNRDHPRVCGEKSMYSGVFYERYRITPAYAGKSFPAGCPRSRSRDHPRVCGEKPRRPPAAAVGIGSPPRMRGKDSIMDGLQGVHGITPAYAGKSDAACIHGAVVGDHPRVCGEKWPAALYEEMERGITPAYAGKSFSSSSSFVLYWDHPRVCGEKAAKRLLPILT